MSHLCSVLANCYDIQKAEVTSLQRQISLQSNKPRHGSSPSVALNGATSPSELESSLKSREATIESMEMEISRLRSQLDSSSTKSSSHSEQVEALEAKLKSSEEAAASAQMQLQDVKKNLERASERAVKEGSSRTSAETKIRSLETTLESTIKDLEDFKKKLEASEKKVTTLTTLHKESENRSQDHSKAKSRLEKELSDFKVKHGRIENENARLKEAAEKRKKAEASGVDNEGLDELEDEERQKLEKRIRDLEAELYEARNKGWREQRVRMQENGSPLEEMAPMSPDRSFSVVDLQGGPPGDGNRGQHSSFSNVLTSGINAFTGGNARPGVGRHTTLTDDLGLGDDDFDEDAFAKAAQEEAMARIERVKEVKRSLKDWTGWRVDLLESGVGGAGIGEVFEI
jgi:hypothetical protein